MNPKWVRSAFISLLLIGGLAGTATAQFESRGSIYGVVTDQEGLVLPGVTLILTSPSLLQSQTAVSSDQGRYRFPALDPGEYRVEAQLSGFQTLARENLRVTGGLNVQANITLGLAAVEEAITVVGTSPTIDFKQNDIHTTWDATLVQEIPTERNITSLINSTPGVSDRTAYGSLRSENTWLFNGVVVNDPATQGSSFMSYDLDSFEEVQIVTGVKSAEIRGAGIFIDIVSKSGGNDFSGGGYYFGQTDSFASDNVSDEQRAQGVTGGSGVLHEYDGGGQLGGPILRDRLWFFTSVRFLDVDSKVIGFTLPDGSEGSLPRTRQFYTVKATGQLGDNHKAQFFWSRSTNRTCCRGANRNTAPAAVWKQDSFGDVLQGTVTSVISDNVFADFRGGILLGDFPLVVNEEFAGPNPVRRIELTTNKITGGPQQIRHHFRSRYNISGAVTWFVENARGSHEIRGGLQFEDGGQDVFQDVVGDATLRFEDGVAAQAEIWNSPTHYYDKLRDLALHVNDTWTVGNQLTLNLGLRVAFQESYWPAQSNRDESRSPFVDLNRTGLFFPDEVVLQENRNIVDWTSTAPRFGVTFDPTGDGTWAIRGSYGRYFAALDSDWADVANPNLPRRSRVRWNDLNGDGLATPDEVDQSGLLTFGDSSGFGAFGDAIAPGVKQPNEDQYMIGVDRKITEDVSFTATFQYRKGRDGVGFGNPLIPFSGYTETSVDNPLGSGTLPVFNLNPEFAGQFQRLMDNQEQATREYKGVEFRINKRYSDNWQLMAALTIGEGKGIATNFFRGYWQDPNQLTHRFGADNFDSKYIARIVGTYHLPADVRLSMNYRGTSGQPNTRRVRIRDLRQGSQTINAEVPGDTRFPAQHLLDIGVEKYFQLGDTAQIGFLVDIFNLLNSNAVTDTNTLFGTIRFPALTFSPSSSFDEITDILDPRAVRLGVRFRF